MRTFFLGPNPLPAPRHEHSSSEAWCPQGTLKGLQMTDSSERGQVAADGAEAIDFSLATVNGPAWELSLSWDE